jgi:hypothetical protein
VETRVQFPVEQLNLLSRRDVPNFLAQHPTLSVETRPGGRLGFVTLLSRYEVAPDVSHQAARPCVVSAGFRGGGEVAARRVRLGG